MNLHDKIVFNIAKKELLEGSESIKIGDRVNDNMLICSKLKQEFPSKDIFTYYGNFKIKFLND